MLCCPHFLLHQYILQFHNFKSWGDLKCTHRSKCMCTIDLYNYILFLTSFLAIELFIPTAHWVDDFSEIFFSYCDPKISSEAVAANLDLISIYMKLGVFFNGPTMHYFWQQHNKWIPACIHPIWSSFVGLKIEKPSIHHCWIYIKFINSTILGTDPIQKMPVCFCHRLFSWNCEMSLYWFKSLVR